MIHIRIADDHDSLHKGTRSLLEKEAVAVPSRSSPSPTDNWQ